MFFHFIFHTFAFQNFYLRTTPVEYSFTLASHKRRAMKTMKKEQIVQSPPADAKKHLLPGYKIKTKDGRISYIIDKFMHEGGLGLIYKVHIDGVNYQPMVLKEFYIDSVVRNANGTLPIQYDSEDIKGVLEKFKNEPERCALLTLEEKDNNHVDWSKVDWSILTKNHLVHPYSNAFQANNDNWYYPMELIPGKNIFQYKEEVKGTMPVDLACQILQCVCQGLELMHKRRLVHCDITPGNIMVDFDEKGNLKDVRLIDYGLTSSLVGKSYIVNGCTYGFADMNEIAAPKPIVYDIYSLGTVLFYMCLFDDKGRKFNNDILEELVKSRQNLVILSPKDEKERKLIALIQDSLSQDHSKRPQTAAGFAVRLEDIKNTVTTTKPVFSENSTKNDEDRSSSGKKRNRILIAVWSIALLLGLAFMIKPHLFPPAEHPKKPIQSEAEKGQEKETTLPVPVKNPEKQLTEDMKHAIKEGMNAKEACQIFRLSDNAKLIVGLGGDSFFEENMNIKDLFTDNTRDYRIGENYRIDEVTYSADSLITEIVIVPIEP